MDVLSSGGSNEAIGVTMNSTSMSRNRMLAPDRFLKACPIRYDCRRLFIYLVEMELCNETQEIETILSYPETRDVNYFEDDAKLSEFLNNVKRFAFPYRRTLREKKYPPSSSYSFGTNSPLVQFYTFVFTDANRIRQYGFCRSSHSGNHILCMISYLPWHNVFMALLNKISNIINERETQSLYHLLEALYEYELPEPGNWAQIFSHDGLDQVRFQCPDRRLLPSIQENRALLKFFAFFDLDKLKQIFTALLLERSVLVVSRDLENLTSCGLSFEYLLYPLEWLHTFVPIVPEHIDLHVFNQPFPFIYGVHQCIFEKLNINQLENCMVILVDDRKIIHGGGRTADILPQNIDEYLTKRLEYFRSQEEGAAFATAALNGGSSSSSSSTSTISLLQTATIKAFLDSVMMVIDDYREYLVYEAQSDEYRLDEAIFFKMKGVYNEESAANHGHASNSNSSRYHSDENEFYHEFRITQAFEEFCRDRCDYLKAERRFYSVMPRGNSAASRPTFPKDFIETLYDQFKSENSKFSAKLDKKFKIFKNKAKEKSTTIKSNLIKTRNQLIKKSSSIENDLKSTMSGAASSLSATSVFGSTAVAAAAGGAGGVQYKPMDGSSSAGKSATAKSSDTANKSSFYIGYENPAATPTTPTATNPSDNSGSPTTTSSSRSSSLSANAAANEPNESNVKETIRRLAEATQNQINSKSIRATIDLSNDPDIKKYFESDNENHDEEDEEATETSNTQTGNLIDILSELSTTATNTTTTSSITTTPLISSPITQLTPTTTTTNKNSTSTTPNNQVIKPASVKPASAEQPVTYKSILNEFDPLNQPNSSSHAAPMNLGPRPFQLPPTSTQFRPNYNISLPPVQPTTTSPTATTLPQSQSLHSIHNRPPLNHHLPPQHPAFFAPRPFYLTPNQSMQNVPFTAPVYRPVNFPSSSSSSSSNTSTNILRPQQLQPTQPQQSNSFDFLSFPSPNNNNSTNK